MICDDFDMPKANYVLCLGPTKVLRFEGVLADDVEENENRKFVIAVSLGDDSVGAALATKSWIHLLQRNVTTEALRIPDTFCTEVIFQLFCGIKRVPSQLWG